MQDIKPVSSREPIARDVRTVYSKKNPAQSLPKEIPFTPTEPKGSSRHGLWIVAVICIAGLFASLSFLFESAIVTIVPKSIPVAFDATDTFTAQKDSTDPSVLSYTVMSLPGDVSLNLPATDVKDVSNFAKGTVTLYNTYSTTPFKIVKNTPIKADDGVMYLIDNVVAIPGYTKSATGTIPGAVDVGITCATSGDIGNIDTSKFTIPYFAKRPQAGKIYAKTKTPITGGIAGLMHTVSQGVADSAYQSLKDKLRASLVAKAKVQVPDGYLFYDGAATFVTDDSVVNPYSQTSEIPLGLHGKLTVYLIKQDSLVKNIVSKFIANYNNEPVTIPKISSLDLVVAGIAPLDPDHDTSMTFSFDGSVNILWGVDQEGIKNALAGKSKASLDSTLAGISGVDKADVVIKPFWKESFPEDPKKITVTVTNPLN